MSDLIYLPREQVHIWIAAVQDWVGASAFQDLLDTLNSEERNRASRFAFDRDREVYTLAHGMLRRVLSRYEAIDPADWTFENNPHGKPLISPSAGSSLRFNISHTAGLAVLAVTREIEVGIDVESLLRTRVRIEVASKAFTEFERRELTKVANEDARRKRFFEIWTLKEAFIKSKGMGLSLPLDQFWFRLSEVGEYELFVDSALKEEPSQWQFEFVRDVPQYLIAVALRSGPVPFKLAVHSFHPVS